MLDYSTNQCRTLTTLNLHKIMITTTVNMTGCLTSITEKEIEQESQVKQKSKVIFNITNHTSFNSSYSFCFLISFAFLRSIPRLFLMNLGIDYFTSSCLAQKVSKSESLSGVSFTPAPASILSSNTLL